MKDDTAERQFQALIAQMAEVHGVKDSEAVALPLVTELYQEKLRALVKSYMGMLSAGQLRGVLYAPKTHQGSDSSQEETSWDGAAGTGEVPGRPLSYYADQLLGHANGEMADSGVLSGLAARETGLPTGPRKRGRPPRNGRV